MKRREESTRAERSDKKVRVNSSLTKTTHEKLDKLAVSCGVSKTGLGAYLIELCLNNEDIINQVQAEYRDKSRFRIIPTSIDGEVRFIYAENRKI